ncbi:hypothetical protein HDV00_003458 [Rhizophlyctis rosea]|nr:hypothetical protein HDV00_003458 [Rhizophlyctis rosea]
MGKRHKRAQRREQSQRDKDRAFWSRGKELSDPLAEYRNFVQQLRESADVPDVTKIPVNLIGLSANLITSLITGRDFLSPTKVSPNTSELRDIETNSVAQQDKETFFFINRIIRRTQLSCTTFLFAVFLIYRLKATGKYDATYSNQDWVLFTNNHYTLTQINHLERTFLHSQNYNLFFSNTDYLQFLSYLDVMLCLRQMYRWSSLSYADLLRLSFKLDPKYLHTLNRTLRPYKAIILLLKTLMKTFAQYIAAVAVASAVIAAAIHQRHNLVIPNLRTIQPSAMTVSADGTYPRLDAPQKHGIKLRGVEHGVCCAEWTSGLQVPINSCGQDLHEFWNRQGLCSQMYS